jgi:hypothetical protein
MALTAVPVVLSGTAGAVPAAPRVKTVACDGGTYTVVRGDGWYRIAGKLGVSVVDLLAANNATVSSFLFAGQVLCVPTPGSAPVTTTPAATTAPTTSSTTTTEPPTTTVPFVGTVSIEQFPVQGICWFADTWGDPRSGGRHHEGVDILAPLGKRVYAVDDGTLTRQYLDRPGALAGNGWRLTRADGTYFFYAHFSSFAAGLHVGSQVQAGQIIGFVGETGNAGAPHLHFEVHPGGGAAVNPTDVVARVDGCDSTRVPTQPGQTPTGAVTTTTTVHPTTTTRPVATTTTVRPTTTTAATTTSSPATTTTTPVAAPASAKWQFVAPVMALDTGALGQPLAAGTATHVRVANLAGVDAATSGVLVRVVAKRVSAAGHLSLHACGAATNGTAALTFSPGNLAATVVAVPVRNGEFCVTSSVGVHVRIAVIAEQAATGVGMTPMAARRAFDSRTAGTLAAGTTKAISPSSLGVSSTAKAVTVTVTLLNPAADGGFGIGACGGTPWIVAFTTASSQTFSAVVRSNAGGICVSSSVDVQATVDVTGTWSGAVAMAATSATRLYDSGSNSVGPTQTTVHVPSAAAAQLQISLRPGNGPAGLSVWNCADRRPSGVVAYAAANTWVTVTVGMNLRGGSLCISSSAPSRVAVDLMAVG